VLWADSRVAKGDRL